MPRMRSRLPSTLLAGPVYLTSSFDVKAVSTTTTDVTGMSINVPASTRPVLVTFKGEVQAVTGTAAAATTLTMIAVLADSSNNALAADDFTVVSNGTSYTARGKLVVELWLDAPVAAGTYKLRVLTNPAPPANWSTAVLTPGYGGTASPKNALRAITF